jgi:hypothetical protein
MVRMVRTFMHKHPRRDRGLAKVMAILAPIALLLMVALVPIHVGSRAAVAAPTGPLAVDGIIYSSGGLPVVGATVIVTIFDGVTVRVVMPTSSDVNGFYAVSVDMAFWSTGNTILVGAQKGSDVGENSTVADEGFPFATIDVHLGVSGIPELGGPATTALTVSAIGMMVVFYARRRRSYSP